MPVFDSEGNAVSLKPRVEKGALPPRSTGSESGDFEDYIQSAAATHNVDPGLLRAMIRKESSGDINAVSPKGAGGLMQLMPATAKRFGVSDRFDPEQNIHGGAAYISHLLNKYGGDVPTALAAYNAGEGAVERHGGQIPPYPETQDYVASIMSRYRPEGGAKKGLGPFDSNEGRELGPGAEGGSPSKDITWGDRGRAVMEGFANVPTTLGTGLEMAGRGLDIPGLESFGSGMREVGKNAEDYWHSGMSEAAQNPDNLWDKIQMSTAESLPGMLVMAIPGMGAANVLAKLGLGAKAAGTVGASASEGLFSALQNAAQTGDEVRDPRRTPRSQLEQNPAYIEAMRRAGNDEGVAREALARAAETDVFRKTLPWTAGTSVLTGGGVLGSIAGKAAGQGTKGLIREIGEGVVKEGAQEALQSAGEQAIQNQVAQQHFDANRPLEQGVGEAALIGAGSGALLGGPGGALSHFAAGEAPDQTKNPNPDLGDLPVTDEAGGQPAGTQPNAGPQPTGSAYDPYAPQRPGYTGPSLNPEPGTQGALQPVGSREVGPAADLPRQVEGELLGGDLQSRGPYQGLPPDYLEGESQPYTEAELLSAPDYPAKLVDGSERSARKLLQSGAPKLAQIPSLGRAPVMVFPDGSAMSLDEYQNFRKFQLQVESAREGRAVQMQHPSFPRETPPPSPPPSQLAAMGQDDFVSLPDGSTARRSDLQALLEDAQARGEQDKVDRLQAALDAEHSGHVRGALRRQAEVLTQALPYLPDMQAILAKHGVRPDPNALEKLNEPTAERPLTPEVSHAQQIAETSPLDGGSRTQPAIRQEGSRPAESGEGIQPGGYGDRNSEQTQEEEVNGQGQNQTPPAQASSQGALNAAEDRQVATTPGPTPAAGTAGTMPATESPNGVHPARSATPRPANQSAVAEYWDTLSPTEREQVAAQAGWKTGSGKPNGIAKNIARKAWREQLSEHRYALIAAISTHVKDDKKTFDGQSGHDKKTFDKNSESQPTHEVPKVQKPPLSKHGKALLDLLDNMLPGSTRENFIEKNGLNSPEDVAMIDSLLPEEIDDIWEYAKHKQDKKLEAKNRLQKGKTEERQSYDVQGVRIYPAQFKGEPVWLTQAEQNVGTDKTLGDTIHRTKDAAEDAARRVAAEIQWKRELDAEEKTESTEQERKKAENRNKSITERKADSVLDSPSRFPAEAGLGRGTKREAMQSAVDQGRAIVAKEVFDSAAKKRDQDTIERVRRKGYIIGLSNENIPEVKAGQEARDRLNADDYKKLEYRVYAGGKSDDGYFIITKTEYDYAKRLQKETGERTAHVEPSKPAEAGQEQASPQAAVEQPKQEETPKSVDSLGDLISDVRSGLNPENTRELITFTIAPHESYKPEVAGKYVSEIPDEYRDVVIGTDPRMDAIFAARLFLSNRAQKISEKPATKPKPLNMAGKTRPEPIAPRTFDSLPQASRDKFNAAFEAKDAETLGNYLYPDNPTLRAEFTSRTGVSLPKAIRPMKVEVKRWAEGGKETGKSVSPEKVKGSPGLRVGDFVRPIFSLVSRLAREALPQSIFQSYSKMVGHNVLGRVGVDHRGTTYHFDANALEKATGETYQDYEVAKPPVILPVNRKLKPSEMRTELLRQIDEAIPHAKDMESTYQSYRKGAPEPEEPRGYPAGSPRMDAYRKKHAEWQKNENYRLAELGESGYITISVPGGPRYKVLNVVQRLRDLRKTIERSSGFSDNPRRTGPSMPAGHNPEPVNQSAMSTIADFMADREVLNAYSFAKLAGVKVAIVPRNERATGTPFEALYDIEPLDIGIAGDYLTGRAWRGKSWAWEAIDAATGLSIGNGFFNSRKEAEKKATERLKSLSSGALKQLQDTRQHYLDKGQSPEARVAAYEKLIGYTENPEPPPPKGGVEHPQASRTGQSAPSQTLSADQALSHLTAKLGRGIETLVNRGVLNFTRGKESWPAAVQEQMQSGDEAVYFDGKAYIDLNAVHPDRLIPVVLHEIGEHHGLAKMLGTKGYQDLQNQVSRMHAAGDAVVTDAWNRVKKLYPDLREGGGSFIAEVIAKVGEHHPNTSWYKRLLAKIKSFLMQIGLGRGFATGTLTGEDLHALLVASLRSAARGNSDGGKSPRFSRGDPGELWRQFGTDSPYFQRWFGNSVVKRGGKPQVVYHGTNGDREAFSKLKLGTATGHETSELGHFFTTDEGEARQYAQKAAEKHGGKPAVGSYYLRIEKPYVVTADLLHERMSGKSPAQFRASLKAKGFDGIYIKDAGYLVAFESHQAKSVENNGEFDIADERVKFSRTERTLFDRYATLGAERVDDKTSLQDAQNLTGIHVPMALVYPDPSEFGTDVPMRYNPETGAIEINTSQPMDRANAAQGMVEELLHSVDVLLPNKTISASSARLDLETGDIAREVQDHWNRKDTYSRFFNYPLNPRYNFTKSRIKAELFARLGTLYFGDVERMRQSLPLAYGAFHEIFAIDTRVGQAGETVRGKVWSGAGGSREVGGGLGAGRGDRSGDHGRLGVGEASRIMGQIRDTAARVLQADRRGGLFQGGLSAEPQFSRTEATEHPFDNAFEGLNELQADAPATSKVWEVVKHEYRKLNEALKAQALGVFTVRQIGDVAENVIPTVKQFVRSFTQMEADRNEWDTKAGKIGKQLDEVGKNRKVAADFGRVVFASTLREVDPSRPFPEFPKTGTQAQWREWQDRSRYWKQIKALYDTLPPNAKQAFTDLRDYFEQAHQERLGALLDRINALPLDAAAKSQKISKLKAEFESLKLKGAYFPLTRKGEWWVYTRGKDGVLGYDKFETREEAEEFVKAEEADGSEILGFSKNIPENFTNQGVPPQFLAGINAILSDITDEQERQQMRDALYQAYLETLPALSMRKSSLHRKKRMGFNQDVNQAFAQTAMHLSTQLARLKHGWQMHDMLDDMKKAREIATSQPQADRAEQRMDNLEFYRDKVLDTLSEDDIKAHIEKSAPGTEAHAKWKDIQEIMSLVGHNDVALDAMLTRQQSLLEAASAMKAADPAAELAGNIIAELDQSYEAMMNPRGSYTASLLNSWGFLWFLGANPASALVNLLQTPTISVPALGAKFGFNKASAEFARAYKQFATGHMDDSRLPSMESHLQGLERKAFDEFRRIGLIDRTLTFDVSGLAESGVKTGAIQRKVMSMVGAMFQHAERLNREVTAMMAYRLAVKSGMAHQDAIDYSEKLTYDTHGDYASLNRARFLRGNTMRVLAQFKQYAQLITYTWGRMIYQMSKGASPEIRKQAARQFGATLVAQTALAGVMGLPLTALSPMLIAGMAGARGMPFGKAVALGVGITGVAMLAASMAGDPDDPHEYDMEFQHWLESVLGETAGRTVAKGMADGFLPFGLHGRTSMSDLWWRSSDREMEGQDAHYQMLKAIAGPVVGGIGGNLFDAVRLWNHGQTERASEKLLPSFIANWAKVVRYESEGGAKTMRGDKLVGDFSVPELVGQAAGFTPARLSERYDRNNALKSIESQLKQRKELLKDRMVAARMENDAAGRREIQDEINHWNRTNPDLALTPAEIFRSMAARRRAGKNIHNGIYLDKKISERLEEYEGAD